MKNIISKIILGMSLLFVLQACTKDDEFDIPFIKVLSFGDDFETYESGSGSTDKNIVGNGWINENLGANSTTKWNCRSFSNNKYAQFASFYSGAGISDEAWLITPVLNLKDKTNPVIEFSTQARSFNGEALTVWYSTDYDGTKDGIKSATWKQLVIETLPKANTTAFVASGKIDLSAVAADNMRIGFKYVGSKSGITTTYQLDNILIYENK